MRVILLIRGKVTLRAEKKFNFLVYILNIKQIHNIELKTVNCMLKKSKVEKRVNEKR